jgi:uncharacterized protein YbjT (DUF2867 family)
MATKKVIVVVGATGNQGGSVARTFLSLPNWHVRCVTRNSSSEASKTLSSKGAELVEADLDDPASIKAAFEDANAIFLNTDFWITWRPAKEALEAEGKDIAAASLVAFNAETTRSRNAVDAAATTPTLERFIYSSLPDVSKVEGGKYNRSKHSASKGWVEDYIKEQYPELNEKTSVIYLGAYNNNPFLTPHFNAASGKYTFALPLPKHLKMPVIDQKESTGPLVRALIEDEDPAKRLLAYDQYPTIGEFVDIWSRVTGKEATYTYVNTQTMHEKMGVSWEHLDPIDAFQKHGYTGGIANVIEPGQLKMGYIARTWDLLLSSSPN